MTLAIFRVRIFLTACRLPAADRTGFFVERDDSSPGANIFGDGRFVFGCVSA
jgi:hypothetical protein